MVESPYSVQRRSYHGRRWCRHLAIVLGGFALAAVTGIATSAEDLQHALPPPTGASAVGRTTFYWTDPTRLEPNTPPADDHRALRVDVWYPAESVEAAAAPYCPDFERFRDKLGLEKFIVGKVLTHTLPDPPILPSPPNGFPVLLLSPGGAMNANWYTALVEELASHGYVVATVDHPFESAAIAYPDGRIVTVGNDRQLAADPQAFERSYRERVDRRAADLSFVLDRLQALDAGTGDTQFADRLDLGRVGVLGHSIGGVAAAKAAQHDPRFIAAVNLDGHFLGSPFVPDSNGAGPRQPFLELCDAAKPPTDKQLAEWKTTRQAFEQSLRRVDELMRTIAGGSFRASLTGANHQSFSDNALWLAANRDERRRRTQVIRDVVRAFFDQTLLGQPARWTELLRSPPEGVTVERFEPR